MSFVIIDVQGFKTTDKTFTPKELAAYDGNQICHYVFKPPFHFNSLPDHLKSQATWLQKNHHCIPWDQGFTQVYNFDKIIKSLTDNVDVVYVKGHEKAEFLKNIISKPIQEFDEQPALTKANAHCFYHSENNCVCALSNVFMLYDNFIMN